MIYNQVIEDDTLEFSNSSSITKNKLMYKFVVILLMSALLSPICLSTNIMPIAYVMIGVASAVNVPLLLVALVSGIFMAISGAQANAIITFAVFFIVYTFVTSLINIKGLSKKYAILIKLVISLLLVQTINSFVIQESLFYVLLYLFSMIATYLIFVHGTSVILNFRKGYIFTQEEQISAICIVAFLLSTFSSITIFNISISNILAIMLVLMFGYRRGSVIGCVTGFIVGLVINLVASSNPTFLITLAAGGLVAGLMNRIGKTATVIGFVIGSALISYFTADFAYYTINIIEIVIASLPVLVIPKQVIKKVEEYFNINNSLSVPYTNLLNSSKDAEEKLNAISDVLNEIADKEISYTSEDKEEFREILKKYIMDYLEDTNLGIKPINKLVDMDKLKICVDYISTKFESGEEVTEDMLIFDCADKKQMITNLKDIYNSVKIMRILKKKEIEVHQKCNREYKEISNIISTMASGISKKVLAVNAKGIKSLREELKMMGYIVYEDDFVVDNDYFEYTFITDILVDIDKQKKEIAKIVSDVLNRNMSIRLLLNISKTEKSKIKLASSTEYIINTSALQKSKDFNEVNGDSYFSFNFGTNKYITAISDGAGSGQIANNSSKLVIDTLEKLIKAGFDETKSTEIVNKIIKLKQDDSKFASLDIAIFNLETADSSFIKFGAAPTYILSDGKVTSINSMNIPVGLVNEAEYLPIVKKLNNNDIIVQISDGVLNNENNIYDNYFTSKIAKINSNLSTKEIANKLLEEVCNNYNGVISDDVTIMVSKVTASKSIK